MKKRQRKKNARIRICEPIPGGKRKPFRELSWAKSRRILRKHLSRRSLWMGVYTGFFVLEDQRPA